MLVVIQIVVMSNRYDSDLRFVHLRSAGPVSGHVCRTKLSPRVVFQHETLFRQFETVFLHPQAAGMASKAGSWPAQDVQHKLKIGFHNENLQAWPR